MIEILEKGFLTLPVTSKRHAFASLGVPAGGPMDSFRYDLANSLVGNSADAPALEATLILPGIRFTDRRAFSVVGGVKGITLLHNGEKRLLPAGETLFAEPGDEILSVPLECGMRAYLAISGGLRIEALRPKPVMKGDRLTLQPGDLPVPRSLQGLSLPMPTGEAVLRVVEGVQYDHFSEDGIRAFYNSEYLYTPQSDRMGIRLSGEAVSFASGHDGNILSEGILMGDIQIPSFGQPILLMADCQTVGGYAKIAHVITADLPIAAQLRPGSKIRFRRVDVYEAQALLHRKVREIRECIRENGLHTPL